MSRLADKVAIVTGGGSGIGAEAALVFAEHGAAVMIADINIDTARENAQAIAGKGLVAEAVKLDLAQPESVQNMISETKNVFGKIDILYNNAAATHIAQSQDFSIESTVIEAWDETMQVNLRGTMLAIKYVTPFMREQGGGSIINMTSGAGQAGDITRTAYGVSKAAIISLTQYAATQLSKEGIRCNAIAPGFIQTPATKAILASHPEVYDIMLAHALTPRVGLPKDIAEMALFLASDASEFITGQVMNVDGGYFAHQMFYADFRRLESAEK